MQNSKEFQDLFARVFSMNGLESYITQPNMEAFQALTRLMLETNAVMNVTALTTLDKIIPLHYADCALIAAFIPQGATVADIGCGGGFPSLPLAILRPDLKITAIDSTEKKVRYVATTAKALGLRLETVSARAEELAATSAYRERFDVVTSRAVARLHILDELCLPFVRVGGQMITMKGAAGQVELDEATGGITKLGGTDCTLTARPLCLLDTQEQRMIIRIHKGKPTPTLYPRPFAKIKKNP